MTFKEQILQGIPCQLPAPKAYDPTISHAPKRKDILSAEEKKLAITNALRYFPAAWHAELAPEFMQELQDYGRIYMYRFRPDYEMYARPIGEYPAQSHHAAAMMLMIQNNLDPAVAQHPHELITYGGNGAVFQNWAQYLLTMKYLAEMTDEQTLHMYSGHPMGLFPSFKSSPRVIISNGMMIPNYSKPDDWEKYNALGVTQYGQMTAGSWMYIGPQGIIHGTTITVMNAFRKKLAMNESPKGKIFLTAGLGGMSGAQPKAGNIVGCISVCAEVNIQAIKKRHSQGWVDEIIDNLDELVTRVSLAKEKKETVSIAYWGNIVDVWEYFDKVGLHVEIGSDQTSLHNPYSGGYYPVSLSFEEAQKMISENPEQFKVEVQASLRRHAAAVNRHAAKGTYFFDYGNAFLLECSKANADVMTEDGSKFRYPSYVQDILGPMYFDYGFGPFRWVCSSGDPKDLEYSDQIALDVLREMHKKAPAETKMQLADNIHWMEEAGNNNMVVGSQARILYANSNARIEIAFRFNEAIRSKEISAPIVLGRDHHDVSGTDSPFRETSNIYDGSSFTADMAVQNVIGDASRGATWVSLHNGGGVGWGEVTNGGFGMVLDGSQEADEKLKMMLLYDVNNGIARRSWARNKEAMFAIAEEMKHTPGLKVTLPNLVDREILNNL
ncbi:urocanate hydratase [Mangrovibacterium diazotrophicum]|uniref:Urocanate hydratase n=1 Tax=Mangrovibacterium diazotrophicum TaxID=1261403 RepID=A0A419W8R3_9BACT|nr:urocanate hydratase [Mangrovibacterium diazotrophicum]RKD91836.1 urocanate hydratase [Mangrovibacterium diazotrophicum]